MIPPFVDPDQIRRRVESASYERGAAYARDGAVRSVSWRPDSAVIESVVDGSGPGTYRCRIRLDIDRPDHLIVGTSCTCPVESDCKHVVATLLAGNRLAQARGRRDAARRAGGHCSPRRPTRSRAGRRPPSRWASSCASGSGAARRRGHRCASRARPRAGSISSEPMCWSASARSSAARASDAWIKGTVSWDVLRRPGSAHEPAQVRWFTELYSIGRDMRLFGSFSDASDWLTLDDIESHLLWPHLATAIDRGIPIVPTKKHTTVTIARDAEIVLRAEQTGGGLELTPRVRIDGEDADLDSAQADRACRALPLRRQPRSHRAHPRPARPARCGPWPGDRTDDDHRSVSGLRGVPPRAPARGSSATSRWKRRASRCRRPRARSSS